jgi:hypothetical protein
MAFLQEDSEDSEDSEEYNLEYGDYQNPTCLFAFLTFPSVYRRPVLFLFHKDQELSLLLSAGGVSYALQRIRDNASQDKTPENVHMVEYILQNASGGNHEGTLSAVASYAVQWKDVKIWKRVIEKAGEDEKDNLFALLGEEKISEACGTFHFDEIQTTCEFFISLPSTL